MERPDLRRQSLSELTSTLTQQMTRLMRAELNLARAELTANSKKAAVGGGLLGAAGAVAFTAWLALVAAAIAGIAEGLPVWASALIGGFALLLLAGMLALVGKARLNRGRHPMPMTSRTVMGGAHDFKDMAGSTRTTLTQRGGWGMRGARAELDVGPDSTREAPAWDTSSSDAARWDASAQTTRPDGEPAPDEAMQGEDTGYAEDENDMMPRDGVMAPQIPGPRQAAPDEYPSEAYSPRVHIRH